VRLDDFLLDGKAPFLTSDSVAIPGEKRTREEAMFSESKERVVGFDDFDFGELVGLMARNGEKNVSLILAMGPSLTGVSSPMITFAAAASTFVGANSAMFSLVSLGGREADNRLALLENMISKCLE
jgi:hypothetical protein